MPVESLPRNTQFCAQCRDIRFWFAHRCHGQADLRWGHGVGPSTSMSTSTCSCQAGTCPLGNQFALELCQGRKNAKDQLSCRGGGVNRRPLTGQYLNPTPRVVRSCTVFTRCRRSRPKRSSFHTTSVSPSRSALRQWVKTGTIISQSRMRDRRRHVADPRPQLEARLFADPAPESHRLWKRACSQPAFLLPYLCLFGVTYSCELVEKVRLITARKLCASKRHLVPGRLTWHRLSVQ